MDSAVALPAPEPERFDVVVVGSGSGNTILDERFAPYRCAIIDHGTFGGTCLNVGCIPTKMFVYPADLALAARKLPKLGIDATVGNAAWARMRDRIFGRIDPISDAGARWREQNENVELLRDTARFVGERTLKVGRRLLRAEHVVLANGARPRMPDLPGVEEVATRLHTSDSIMRLQKLPRSLVIIGGGYVAAEFAHVFASLGVKVTVINRSESLLSREDRDIARVFTAELSERAQVRLRQQVTGFLPVHDGLVVQASDAEGTEYEYDAEVALVALGRIPNADTLAAAAGGVELTDDGYVKVDEHQATTAPNVWALGDVCSPWQLKHVANHEARVVQANLLQALTGEGEPVAGNHDAIPHAVFSSPQVAAVGQTEAELEAAGRAYVKATQRYADVAYGWAMEDEGAHIVKVLADPETRLLLGAHIVGPDAASLLQPLVQAMALGTPLDEVARGQYWIHPALPEVVENALLRLGFNEG